MNRKMTELEFIWLWEDSDSIAHVLERTGYTYGSAASKASRLRQRGVNLKLFMTTDSEYFARIGAIGGHNGHTGGFYARRDLASAAGRKGGKISKRNKKELE